MRLIQASSSRPLLARCVLIISFACLLVAPGLRCQNYQQLASKLSYPDSLDQSQSVGDQDSNQESLGVLGERVDKLISPAGDQYLLLASNQPNLDWFSQQSLQDEQPERSLLRPVRVSAYNNQARKRQSGNYLMELEGQRADGSHNYRTLVNDFRHWVHLANPSREGRAFKPKLMSTARGFGKRSGNLNSQHQASLDELLGSASSGGKLSGNAIR